MTELASSGGAASNEPVDSEGSSMLPAHESKVPASESTIPTTIPTTIVSGESIDEFERDHGSTATLTDTPALAPDAIADAGDPRQPDGEPAWKWKQSKPPRTPRTRRELVESISTFVVVAGVVLFTFSMLHPAEIFTSAVPTGGDMGAHIWGPAYLRDHLLPHLQLTGYSDSWYEGFPVYRYYMLPPALLIVALNTFLTYGAAFKIVVVLGSLTMPITAWKFGKLARFAYPIPALFAVAAGIFLFDESFKIQGGNIASTMAGEFSFSLALSLSLLALGYFAAGMETGKYRVRAVVLIALAMLCHGIVLIFVAIGVVVLFLCWVGTERYAAGWPMPLMALGLLAVAWIGNDYKSLKLAIAVAIGCFLLLAIVGLFRADRKRYIWGIPVMVVSGMLIMFWFGPFFGTSSYLTDMKYEPAPGVPDWDTWWKMYFPHTTTTDRFWAILAIVGIVGAVARRHRNGVFLATYCIFLAAGVKFAHASLPGVGLLWDTRVLPFFYLLRYLLAMLGIFEVVCVFRSLWNHYLVHRAASVSAFHPYSTVYTEQVSRPAWEKRNSTLMIGTLLVTSVVSVSWLAWHLGRFPLEEQTYSAKNGYELSFPRWGNSGSEGYTLFSTSAKNQGFVSGWTQWNFTGYVGKPAYGEYRALMEQMISVGKTQGCGRALFEEPPGDYGTTLALMPMPFWTDNCIKSSEGLFFESSATTPYHFLAKAEMSQSSSNPVRGLSYENQNAATGVREMQDLGIRYYMAYTKEAVARADKVADLRQIATSGPWHIYIIAQSDLVVPLKTQPVVVNERSGDQKERWLEIGQSYFQHPEDWAGAPAAGGPKEWQRVDVAPVAVEAYPKVEQVRSVQTIASVPLPDVTVTNVIQADESVSFTVDKIGVPIEVKVSDFPNWTVSGAQGPYRIAPNMMVVIPTSNNVRLEYKMSGLDKGSYLITLLGLFALFGLWKLNKRQEWIVPSGVGADAYGWSPHDYPGLALPIVPWSASHPPADDDEGPPSGEPGSGGLGSPVQDSGDLIDWSPYAGEPPPSAPPDEWQPANALHSSATARPDSSVAEASDSPDDPRDSVVAPTTVQPSVPWSRPISTAEPTGPTSSETTSSVTTSSEPASSEPASSETTPPGTASAAPAPSEPVSPATPSPELVSPEMTSPEATSPATPKAQWQHHADDTPTAVRPPVIPPG